MLEGRLPLTIKMATQDQRNRSKKQLIIWGVDLKWHQLDASEVNWRHGEDGD